MEEKENLIKKLGRIWADFRNAVGKSKIVKGVATTALAAGLLASAAGCKGYKIYVVPDPPIDQTQTDDPNKDLNDDQSGNQQNQGSQPGGSTTPTTPTQPDYSQYSQLLQDILKSDYYNGLIAKHKAGQLNQGSIDAGFNIIHSLPFNFLESVGEDVEEIKNNNIKTGSYEYVKTGNKNELYSCITITKNNSQTDAYETKYLLKYNLTNQEYKDYQMLINGEYYQSSFFVQELDKTRKAELVNKFSISQKNYEGLIKYINNNNRKEEGPLKLGEKEISDFFLKPSTIEFEDRTSTKRDMYIDIEFVTANNDNKASSKRELGSARILFDWFTNPSCVDDLIYLNDPTYVKVLKIYNSEPINVFHHYIKNNLNITK